MNKKISLSSAISIGILVILSIFIIFQFSGSSFTNFILGDLRITLAALAYSGAALMLLSRKNLFGLIMLAVGIFLAYFYVEYWGIGHFSVNNASIYQICYAICAVSALLAGIKLYQRNENTDRLLAYFWFPVSAVCIILVVCDMTLPKPRQFDFPAIMVTIIFIVMSIAGSIGLYAFMQNKNRVSKILSVVYGTVSIGALFLLVFVLNNVPYNGCYPHSPIGCACTLNTQIPTITKTDSTEIKKVDTPTIIKAVPSKELVEIPSGGSLCGTLGMTLDEALTLAKHESYKVIKRRHATIVIIHPGDTFQKVDGQWKKVN